MQAGDQHCPTYVSLNGAVRHMRAGVVLGAIFVGTVAGSALMFATQARRQGRGGPAGASAASQGEAAGPNTPPFVPVVHPAARGYCTTSWRRPLAVVVSPAEMALQLTRDASLVHLDMPCAGGEAGNASGSRGAPASKRPPPLLVRNPGGEHDVCFAVKDESGAGAAGEAQAGDAAALQSSAAESAGKREEFHDIAM